MGYYGELQGGELYNKEKFDMAVKQNTGRVSAYTPEEYVFNKPAFEEYTKRIKEQVMEEVRDVMSFKQVGLSGYFTITLDEWKDLCGKLGVTV